MSLRGDDRQQANVLQTRANSTNRSQSLATPAVADAQSKTTHATDEAKENSVSPNMASNTHLKQPSTGSLPDFGSFSPDESRIPRPTSTSSKTRSREPLRMTEALKLAADRHRAIQGSPSPAPRLSRMGSSSSDFKPLHDMFSQKPIDLGRLGTNSTRRGGTLSSRDSFGSASRKEDDSDNDIDRKLKQFEEDQKILKAMREEKKGLFVRRRSATSSIGSTTPISAHRASATKSGPSSFGNDIFGTSSHDEPRSTWGDKAKYDPNWLRQFQNHPDAAVAFHERVSGPKKNSSEQDQMGTPARPARPATAGPPSRAEPFKWPVDDDFTAGDLQVSTSPPVSFGRPNTKLDELRKLEIDVERKYPIPNDLFARRSNTRLDEIARLEKEAAMKYHVINIEDSGPVAMADVQPPREIQPSFSPSRIPLPSAESGRAAISLPSTELATKIPEEPTERRSPLPEIRRKASPEPPQRPSPRSSQEAKDVSQTNNGISSLEGQKTSNIPATISSGTGPSKYENTRRQAPSTDGVVPELLEKESVKDDAQDLLRRLARASSKSPSLSPVLDKADIRSQDDQNVAPTPFLDDKIAPIAKRTRTKGANKTGSPSKPRVGFTGISRSSSTTSVSSKRSSVASHDPTARIEAEADLFALDNQSERGSFRVPSPLSDSESEAEDNKTDDTPRPDKSDPAPMPTPLVTGAYIDTPATVKVERRDVSEDTNIPQPNLSRPRKDLTESRDTSTSPKASRSDSQAGYMRRRSLRETRRSKSAPRHRSPLKNSAKPPTVKEDLWQICRKNDIDDSTLDDLTDLVMSSANPEELVNILKNEEPTFEYEMAELAPAEQLKALDRFLASVRTAKKGIEDLETRVSRSEKPAEPTMKTPTIQHRRSHPTHDPTCPECAALGQPDVYTYMHVPVPRLYRRKPKFRLTFTGFLMLLLCLWHLYWFTEDLFYDRWGKQEFCYRGSPCRWDVDDPEYGYVIPVKLDEWITGGVVRPHAARWLEEAQDSWADFEDWWRGTNIQQVDHRTIRDSSKKAQYWRRIEKKGLFPKWNPASWMLPQIEAWERETAAQEEAEARAAMGYNVFEEMGDESMDKDQPIQSDSTHESTDSWW